MSLVGVVMGSKTDEPLMQPALDVLKQMGIEYEVSVISAHRTPDKVRDYGLKAEERGIYDLLITGDYVHYLQETDARYDLFTATDVFIYAGNLSPVFAAVRRAALPGAWVAFSTERCEGEGFTLRRTGRYAHASRYIRSLAGEYGFSMVGWRDEVIRREDETAIEGDVVILRRE